MPFSSPRWPIFPNQTALVLDMRITPHKKFCMCDGCNPKQKMVCVGTYMCDHTLSIDKACCSCYVGKTVRDLINVPLCYHLPLTYVPKIDNLKFTPQTHLCLWDYEKCHHHPFCACCFYFHFQTANHSPLILKMLSM